MKVKELIKILQCVDPEMVCVCTGFDHSYRGIARPVIAKAEQLKSSRYNEFHGPDLVADEQNPIVDVLVFE